MTKTTLQERFIKFYDEENTNKGGLIYPNRIAGRIIDFIEQEKQLSVRETEEHYQSEIRKAIEKYRNDWPSTTRTITLLEDLSSLITKTK